MSTATITLTDADDGQNVDVTVEFGEKGADNGSNAHRMAITMVRSVAGALEGDDNE